MSNAVPVIAIDGDGVVFDYPAAYIGAWERAFGYRPTIKNPNAYWIADRLDIPTLAGAELEHFRSFFDEEFWATMPLLPGAAEAVSLLVNLGYDPVMVTAIDQHFADARWENIQDNDIPFSGIIATPTPEGWNRWTDVSPKAHVVMNILEAEAFVDDYIPFFRGVSNSVFRCLISDGIPKGQEAAEYTDVTDIVVPSLLDFAKMKAML